MKIAELKAGMQDVDLEATVKEKGETKQITTKYGPNRVSNAVIEDDSGSVKLTLWGKQVDQVEEGDKISIKGAYTKEWNGELQVNIGRNGEMKVER
ncbi:DNA-binding protein [Candidatus Micrarchaeota archaeon]|nr:MAG: DNA-binding protein [Candidatus Micrarchaeota archaeon]